MKGLAMIQQGTVGFVEKDLPAIGEKDALIKVKAVAVCSSDLHSVKMGAVAPNNYLGHEAIGEVVQIGEAVNDFKVGDRVMIPAITPDWGTLECQNNLHQHSGGMLQGIRFSGTQDGSFAEYVAVIQADMNLACIPDEMDDMDALMTVDMVTTGFYGVELAEVKYGECVAIIGIGPVGLMAVLGARLRGAGRIIAVGSRENCVNLAKEYGATDIINYKKGDIVEQIMALTGGVDKCIIAGGGNDVINQAISILKPGGTVANMNYFDNIEPLPIYPPAWGFGMAHKTIKGGLCPGGRLRMERLIDTIRFNNLKVSKLVTHKFYGIETLEEAYKFMESKDRELIKPVVIL